MARRRNRKRGEETARFWITVFKWGGIVALVGAVSVSSYLAGKREAENNVSGLQEQLDTLRKDSEHIFARNRELEVSLAEALREGGSYKSRLDAIAPSAELKSLIAQMQKRLNDGIAADRIALFISLADKPRGCQVLDKKRFYVRLSSRIAPENQVTYPGGVNVNAEGMAGSGNLSGAFDPAQPVNITFTFPDGKEIPASGLLPLTHEFVLRNSEYRFTLTPSGRGLVEITGERCDLL